MVGRVNTGSLQILLKTVIPRPEAMTKSIVYFTSLDMASGFHKILIHPDSVEKTGFVTPFGQFEYLMMAYNRWRISLPR